MKTENLFAVLFLGGLVGFLGAISLKMVGGTNPFNVSWLFFFIILGTYICMSAIFVTAKIKFNWEILK